MDDAAPVQPLESWPKGLLEMGDKVGVGGATVQEERELRGEGGGEGELSGEGVALEGGGAVV